MGSQASDGVEDEGNYVMRAGLHVRDPPHPSASRKGVSVRDLTPPPPRAFLLAQPGWVPTAQLHHLAPTILVLPAGSCRPGAARQPSPVSAPLVAVTTDNAFFR